MIRRTLVTTITLALAFGLRAQPVSRHQYLVVLSRSIQKSGLTALGATVDADLNDTLVVTIDDDHVELLRNCPGVRYLQRVITAGQRGEERQRNDESFRDSTLATMQHQAITDTVWGPGEYSYDAAGNVTSIGTGNTFWYDGSSRLVHAGVSGHTQDYAYDGFGNMTSMTTDAQPRSLTTTSSTNQLAANLYDVAGNVRTDDFGYQYVYDAFNMVQDKRQGLEIDIYDGSDERIGVLKSGQWTWTLRDESGKVLREYRTADSTPSAPALWLGDYVWRDGSLVAAQRVAEEGGARHFHLDHLGNPRLVTGVGGAQIAAHDFYPFGREITPMNQDTVAGMREDAFRFTGHERDWNSGTLSNNTDYLDYMHARYYNPNAGRFLSIDSGAAHLQEPQGWNRYTYTSNNPLKYSDPNGRAKLRFELTTSIPFKTVTVPSFSGLRTFHGDLGANTFRTRQTVVIETDQSTRTPGSSPIFGQKNEAGMTIEYNRKTGATIGTAVASSVGSASGEYANGSAIVRLTTDATNPMVTGAPAINNELTITTTKAGGVSVNGTLDGFPSVTLTMTNEHGQTFTVFQFDPRTVGNGPFSLFPWIGDQTVSARCTSADGGCEGSVEPKK
jgi:RHS repeat-associated protein